MNNYSQALSSSFALVSLKKPRSKTKLRTRVSQKKTVDAATGKTLCELIADAIGSNSASAQSISTGAFAPNDLKAITEPIQTFKKWMEEISSDCGIRGQRLLPSNKIQDWNIRCAEFQQELGQGIWKLRCDWHSVIQRSKALLGDTFKADFFPEESELEDACRVETQLILIDPNTPLGTLGSIISSAVQTNTEEMTQLLLDFSKVLEKRLIGERTAIHESTVKNIFTRARKLREIHGESIPDKLQDILAKMDQLQVQTATADFGDKKSPAHLDQVRKVQETAKAMAEELEGF